MLKTGMSLDGLLLLSNDVSAPIASGVSAPITDDDSLPHAVSEMRIAPASKVFCILSGPCIL